VLQFIVTAVAATAAAAVAAARTMEHETMDKWQEDVSDSQLIAAAELYEGTCV